jgi:hypothetical protein
LNRFEIISFIEEGGGEGVPDHMGMDSYVDQPEERGLLRQS